VVRAAFGRRISLEEIVALSRGDFDGSGSQANQAGLYRAFVGFVRKSWYAQ
jgi:hypothetical protein